jgi:threonine/homoserine efflux transporter RhtA
MRKVPSMAVAVYLPPLGAVKAATSVMEGEAADPAAEVAVVDAAVPFWVSKFVTSGSRTL